MPERPKRSDQVSSQSKRFVEAARELGCDDSEAAFDAKLKKVASAPPPKPEPKSKAKKSAK